MSGTVGDQQVGSYRILQPLGTGGMSSVYRAVHVDTGHEVALKLLTRTLARNSTLLQRFLREAKSAEALVHPNIVTIYDRGIDLGRHYIVLEYVAGGDFHDYVRAHGPLSVAAARSVIRDVAEGLEYAASQGLIHRDIKPSNILRTPTGQIKIIDLGLALHSDFEDERVTREGTTVGTVDYMAPEQARDSRAASIQSDIYSLGCTFYYLLTGIPPYPGGDITDKLTRHARAAVPNVADLRPDVPADLAKTIERMMAKQPEDRFASYDELVSALEQAPVAEKDESIGYALAPVDQPKSDKLPELPGLDGGDGSGAAGSVDLSLGSIPVFPVESQTAQLALDSNASLAVGRAPGQPSAPIPRLSRLASQGPPTSMAVEAEPAPPPKAGGSISGSIWIIGCLSLGIAVILVFMGWVQYMDSNAGPIRNDSDESGTVAFVENVADAPAAASRHEASPPGKALPAPPVHQTAAQVKVEPPKLPSAPWEEPVDVEKDVTRQNGFLSELDKGWERLPDWARSSIPDRVNGPSVVVRRIVEPGESQTLPEINMALDRYVGGTVELADEGPLYEDDFRVAGETRLIRARQGCRAIVQIQSGRIDAVRQRSAVVVLDHKTLILDGIDFIVNARDLASRQTALFSCSGANLTLKNCTVTVLNPTREMFAFLRIEPAADRSTRIRLERTLVRGWFTSGIDIGSAATDVVINKSVLVSGSGPLIRLLQCDGATERRIYFTDTILAGTGPIIDRAAPPGTSQSKPAVIRAYGSAFGRLRGRGIASVICSTDPLVAATRQVDWQGGHNLFAGWIGFFAHGKDPSVSVANLASVRSTWNSAETESLEIPHPWWLPSDPSTAVPWDLTRFLSKYDAVLAQIAQPRSGLLEKTVFAYPLPWIPEPLSKARRPNPGGTAAPRQLRIAKPILSESPNSAVRAGPASSVRAGTSDREMIELTFDTSSPPWNGDLGAFLKDRLVDGIRYARVQVVGSGNHRCSQVQLPRGIQLEIRVEATGPEPPSWSSDPQATGPGLIEVQEGALVLLNFILHHDPASRVEHLIDVEGGHLVLSQCRLTTPVSSPNLSGDLIAFRAPTTRPVAHESKHPVFSTFVDRPVCLVLESLLITNGTALKAELGRGLIALEQTAVAAGDTAIDLYPSRVARWRFETDLFLANCTLTAERTIVRMGGWPGLAPGPDRPWLVTSQNCAFMAMYEKKTRETVLLRCDPSALAHGSIFWQALNDAADVDYFTALPDAAVPANRQRDVDRQWITFWGQNHMQLVSGPRGPGSPQSVWFREKLHPGHVEPADLVLDPDYRSSRHRVLGADLGLQGIVAKSLPTRRRRN
jgi:serine/threonine protein kinase